MARMSYDERKAVIRAELLKRARAGETITYEALGQILDVPFSQRWKRALDAISDEEWSDDRPDITCLVVSIATSLPRHVRESTGARAEALEERQRVFDFYRA